MTSCLTLIIPDDWPEHSRECPWLLSNAQGRLLQHGYSGPAGWPLPQADADSTSTPMACNLLLAGQQISVHLPVLPAGGKARQPDVLAGILEDDLLDDPQHLYFVCQIEATHMEREQSESGRHPVAVISRARLRALCERLQELGLQVRSAWPLLFCLPRGEAMQIGEVLDIRLPNGGGLALGRDELERWKGFLRENGIEFPLPCRRIAEHARFAAGSIEAARIGTTASVPDSSLLRALEMGELRVPPGHGFLYGPLLPALPLGAWRQVLRLPARLAIGFAVAALLMAAADWGRMSWLAWKYQGSIKTEFSRVIPQGTLVDAGLQLQRHVDALETQQGLLKADDFLNLLQPLASLQAGSLTGIDYEPGVLRVNFALKDGDGEVGNELTAACRGLGLACTWSSASQAGRTLSITPAGKL